jgi:hypothetical protein
VLRVSNEGTLREREIKDRKASSTSEWNSVEKRIRMGGWELEGRRGREEECAGLPWAGVWWAGRWPWWWPAETTLHPSRERSPWATPLMALRPDQLCRLLYSRWMLPAALGLCLYKLSWPRSVQKLWLQGPSCGFANHESGHKQIYLLFPVVWGSVLPISNNLLLGSEVGLDPGGWMGGSVCVAASLPVGGGGGADTWLCVFRMLLLGGFGCD